MCCLGKESEIKNALRNLCLTTGWSYAVFWRFDHPNSMLLTVEDAYYEEYAKSVTHNLLLQVHMLGDGIIGQAAIDGNHRWVFSDSSAGKNSFSTGHFQTLEDNSYFSCEFSAGIKTIAVIPLESCGVLQFGSLIKISETPAFVDRARHIFQEMDTFDRLLPSGNATSSLISDTIHQSGQFHPLISSYNSQALDGNNISIPSSSCLLDQGNFSGFNALSSESIDNQCLDPFFNASSNLHGFDDFNSTEFPTPYDDDALPWPYSEPTLNDDILQALVEDLPTVSYQRSDLLPNGYQTHFGNVKKEETVEDMLYGPLVDSLNTGSAQRLLIVQDSSTTMSKKGLFSELGLDQILGSRAESSSFAKSSAKDSILAPNKFMMKANAGLWAEQSFTTDAKSCVTDQTKGSDESSKASKKRARPGESARARPKDRQMIQDRIKELRVMIPNGAKCSIDALLDRTINHMLFMQGATKYADKLKRAEEAKDRRNTSNNGGMSSSAAWAIDVGGQNPIVVEDLGHSGQMLIEMVCEEQGLFLEIADVIRGFGLTILKGDMEAKDGKLFAHFNVEASRQVTRVEVLMSLLQLLKDTSITGLESVGDRDRILGNNGPSLMKNYHHQPMMSLPIGLADGLR